jgi:hypothetical protein
LSLIGDHGMDCLPAPMLPAASPIAGYERRSNNEGPQERLKAYRTSPATGAGTFRTIGAALQVLVQRLVSVKGSGPPIR